MSSITLDQPDPTIGSVVTFTIETNKTDFPWIEVICIKDEDGEVGFAQTLGAYPAAPGEGQFTLGPTQVWQSGSAMGTATLFSSEKNKRKDLASCDFPVAG